ncbi:RNA polymerase, sigma-24 subunit, ECF subfamily [Clostridium cellulovorans 743B]|uniref:RNA polymerase, sigma-24 subunit, ECF subfamily n=2 Tax=Clostridium cellulovorans TaxID=1493 RepID=D9SM61_CLOC7|nr:RNA polymerase, sigma-24 subunit, ECF subfamily [Clostridium cellulovorans 743B]
MIRVISERGFTMDEVALDEAILKTDDIIEDLHKYADMVRRICFIYLRDEADVEDVFQDVFLKLMQNDKVFNDEEHKKAWICRVTINKCKDLCKSFFRKKVCSIDDIELPFEDKIETDVLLAVLSLPAKYKSVVYLFYYGGYTVPQISDLLKEKENTIYSNLHRARKYLREKLGGVDYE